MNYLFTLLKNKLEQIYTILESHTTSINSISKIAKKAKTTANNAQSTANNAKTTADNAQSTANNAKTTADNAQSTANNNTSNKMSKTNPTGSGYFSLNRKSGSVVGDYSHAEGYNTTASGDQSHAEGYGTTASGVASHAEGYYSSASGSYSHSEGGGYASGIYSHAEGNATMATKCYCHAEGYNSKATSDYSHAEGYTTTASGTASHAEGYFSAASGKDSHAEGYGSSNESKTIASGLGAHAEGYKTTASGANSHTEGNNTTASGQRSHAEGYYTKASGSGSHAEGQCTKATGDYSHAQGKYNIEDSTNTLSHIVGNGSSNTACSNAHTLDWNGNAWYAGDVYVGSTSGTNKDEGSIKLAKVTDIPTVTQVQTTGTEIAKIGDTSIYIPNEELEITPNIDENGNLTFDVTGNVTKANWQTIYNDTTIEDVTSLTCSFDKDIFKKLTQIQIFIYIPAPTSALSIYKQLLYENNGFNQLGRTITSGTNDFYIKERMFVEELSYSGYDSNYGTESYTSIYPWNESSSNTSQYNWYSTKQGTNNLINGILIKDLNGIGFPIGTKVIIKGC